jgi:hypothetical protein
VYNKKVLKLSINKKEMIIMGGGNWSASTYASTTKKKIDTGTSFGYSTSMKSNARPHDWKAHELLDPKRLAGAGSPFEGQTVRESRDNADHPNSVPIATIFDVTGSMGTIPVVVQSKLAGLFGLLLRKGYVEDPQIMVGAYGDAYSDRVPLQVGQFESDNRIDECLDKIFIEKNGGANGGETQSLAWYYLAHHTATDAWDKRKKKGYAFFVADEIALDLLPEHIRDHIGDGEPFGGDLTVKNIAKSMTEKWDVFILLIDNMSARIQGSEKFYKDLFGAANVLVLEDPESVAETIALTIGAMEGTVDLDDAIDDLKETGASALTIRSATKAVAGLANLNRGVVASGNANLDIGGNSGASRL